MELNDVHAVRKKDVPLLWVVVPCYNEEMVLPVTAPLFLEELKANIARGAASPDSRICFVDDGSCDATWDIIQGLACEDEHFCGVSLSRNRGHQNALLAGLMEARGRCDVAISVDCDGQDDLHAMGVMLDEYRDGSDVVYGVRSSRATDTAFKRLTAEAFYGLMRRLGAETVFNHADYRLMSRRALDGISEFGETNLFLRGMVPLVGYRSSTVEYEREERLAGESHYPLKKMLALALDGVTSLSVKPLHLIALLGALVSLIGVVGVAWAVSSALAGRAVSGWASTVCLISFFGGLQLFALGVIGEYVGKIYLEVKGRPRYIVAERTWVESDGGSENA